MTTLPRWLDEYHRQVMGNACPRLGSVDYQPQSHETRIPASGSCTSLVGMIDRSPADGRETMQLLPGLSADRAAPIVTVPRYHLPGGYEGKGAEVRGVGLWSDG